MKLNIIRDKKDFETKEIANDLIEYINGKFSNIKVIDDYDNTDIFIILSDNISDFLEFFNNIPLEKRKYAMLLTNNIEVNYILMALKFVDNVTYIKLNVKFLEDKAEYINYKAKNNKRIIKNILNFAAQKNKFAIKKSYE